MIQRIQYHDGLTDNRGVRKLEIEVIGFPNHCINKSHALAQLILGDAPWHFTSLQFDPPPGKNLDDRWMLFATAQRK